MFRFPSEPEPRGDDGTVEREPASKLDTGFLTGLVATTAYLAVWWSQLPSVEAVTAGAAEPNAWATAAPLAGLAVPFGLAGLAALVFPGLRAGLSARLSLVRWPLLVGLLVASLALGVTAPTVYRAAGLARLAREADEANQERFRLALEQSAAAHKAADEAKSKEEREARHRLVNEQEAAIKTLQTRSKEELAARLQVVRDAHTKSDAQAAAKAKALEAQLAAQKKARAEADEARRKAEAALAKKGKEAGKAPGPDVVTAPPAGPGTGPKGSGGGGGGDSFQQFMGAAMAAAAFAINPALGMVFASLLGITTGTDYKTTLDTGRAVLDSFPGGKFNPETAKKALERLAAEHPTPEARRLAAELLAAYQAKVEKTDKDEAGRIAEFLPKLDEIFSPEKAGEALAKVIEPHWDSIVGDAPTPEKLAKLVAQVEGLNRALKPEVVREAVVRFARSKNVPESVLTKVGDPAAAATTAGNPS